jgi:predicted Zn finger-like uncharacterized protein
MTDEIQVSCPSCAARMRVHNPQIVGKRIRCPKCSEPFVATQNAPPRAASRRAALATRGSHKKTVEVDDEYGGPAQLLGDPRTKPNQATESPTELPPPPPKKSRKKKRKKSRDVPEPSGPKMFLCGLIGGSIGGVVWVACAFFLHVHLGIIAILVGVLTGVGVQTGNSGQDSHGPGEIAVVTAFVVILVSKFIIACLLAGRFVGPDALKAFTPYDIIWCAIAGRWAYRTASGALF